MPRNGFRAMTLATALVGWSGVVAPRLASRWLTPIHAALAAALVARTDSSLGLRPPASTRGLRWGLVSAAAVSAAVASSTAVAPVRRGMNQRDLPRPAAGWLLVRIPIGTVWSEEAAFRGALGTVAAQAFGSDRGRILQAVAFGLSHVADARGAGESVVGTVLVTGTAGWLLGWLYDRTGSLVAPMLVHLAVNEAGAVAALAVQTSGVRD
jgi:membrane protease YdiL (CAAX protease family)